MDSATYATLSRQSGLMREMQVLANNIANAATTGYRAEAVIFTEFVRAPDGAGEVLSMAHAGARHTDASAGGLRRTGGSFDLAIEGPGFFRIETPQGERLTRAGAFALSPAGEMLTPQGGRLLDAGGAPVFAPPEARSIAIARDGTLSADGQPVAQIGLVEPEDPRELIREDGVRFRTSGALRPVEAPTVLQGFLETSNVSAVSEIARLIEVQRGYELGQGFLDQEDERVRGALRTLGS
ncbi:MAG: flagellar basal-body rod protein FlgF [Alphaproteobacteria bacterium HGW-Alphaproteobacteria-2]|nr:MAG: flagellar basal-body rod protein FlgF [Alphaproteobacteria bacterium HGW-Alphaproteobacteria-2]